MSIVICVCDLCNDDNDSSFVWELIGLSLREMYMVCIVVYIIGVLVFCYLFFMVMLFVDMLMEDDVFFDYLLYLLVEIIMFLNFFLNLFLYCWCC